MNWQVGVSGGIPLLHVDAIRYSGEDVASPAQDLMKAPASFCRCDLPGIALRLPRLCTQSCHVPPTSTCHARSSLSCPTVLACNALPACNAFMTRVADCDREAAGAPLFVSKKRPNVAINQPLQQIEAKDMYGSAPRLPPASIAGICPPHANLCSIGLWAPHFNLPRMSRSPPIAPAKPTFLRLTHKVYSVSC